MANVWRPTSKEFENSTFNEENVGYYEADDAWEYKCMRTGTIYGIIDK